MPDLVLHNARHAYRTVYRLPSIVSVFLSNSFSVFFFGGMAQHPMAATGSHSASAIRLHDDTSDELHTVGMGARPGARSIGEEFGRCIILVQELLFETA